MSGADGMREDQVMSLPISQMNGQQLKEYLEKVEPGSEAHTRVMSEIARRQLFETFRATEAQIAAAEAEKRAAEASQIAAKAAVKNAQYMLWSVIIAALAAVASAVSAYYASTNASQAPATPPSPPGITSPRPKSGGPN